jgi:hypothetical protein
MLIAKGLGRFLSYFFISLLRCGVWAPVNLRTGGN